MGEVAKNLLLSWCVEMQQVLYYHHIQFMLLKLLIHYGANTDPVKLNMFVDRCCTGHNQI